MKEKWKEYSLGLRICFLILCFLEILLMVYTMLHPRFINFFNIVLLLLVILVVKRWMEKGIIPESVSTSGKDSEEKQNNEKGEKTANEERDLKKAKVKAVIKLVVNVAILEYMLTMFAALFNLLFPYHAIYEYSYDIKQLKTSTYYDRSFYPDEVPQEAKKAQWIMLPSFLQGSGTEVLFFEATPEFIQSEIMRVVPDVTPGELETGMDFVAYLSDEQEDGLQVYKLYDNGDGNHLHMWGIFVNERQNLIGYFCQ